MALQDSCANVYIAVQPRAEWKLGWLHASCKLELACSKGFILPSRVTDALPSLPLIALAENINPHYFIVPLHIAHSSVLHNRRSRSTYLPSGCDGVRLVWHQVLILLHRFDRSRTSQHCRSSLRLPLLVPLGRTHRGRASRKQSGGAQARQRHRH